MKTFEKFKVLNERELHARYEVNLETYSKTINVEAQLMVLMANRYILPAALEYQKRGRRERRGGEGRPACASKEGKKLLDQDRQAGRPVPRRRPTELAAALDHAASSAEKHAKYMRDTVVPAMARAA